MSCTQQSGLHWKGQIMKNNTLDTVSVELGYAKHMLKKADAGSAYFEHLVKEVARLTALYAQLKEQSIQSNTPKTISMSAKPSNGLRYKEIEINGDIYLECTSCSADGPGNCGCWSNH